jgi:anti-sigma factor RsiW
MMLRDSEHDGRMEAPAGAVLGHLDDWEELAVDYLDGQLDSETATSVEAHLSDCPACAARLQTQQRLISFLEQIDFEDPPADLENLVLGEALLHSKPVQTVERAFADEPSRWSMLWRRKIVPWAPVTVALVALLVAGLSYGLLRSGGGTSMQAASQTTLSQDAQEKDAEAARIADASAGESADSVTTTAVAATTPMLGAGATIAPSAESTLTTTFLTYSAWDFVTTRDKETMIADLEAAGAPAYFVFEGTAAPAGGGEEDIATGTAVAEQLTALTGLEPLDESLWLDGPTFAAYVPRDNAKQLVDLLLSIGASFQFSVGLAWQPLSARVGDTQSAGAGSNFAPLLMERKAEFAELSAHPTPQPAVTPWSFTTSTSAPATDAAGGGTSLLLPDEAGTHVLVVIYVRK